MPEKIWVPQPATQLYGGNAESIRDRFVRQYGEASVMKAELSVCLDVMLLTGMIKPAEFVDVLGRKLQRIDNMRRAAANLDADRG